MNQVTSGNPGGGWSRILPAILLWIAASPARANDDRIPRISNPRIETDSLRVHFVEFSRSVSQSSARITWSAVFMIEYLGSEPVETVVSADPVLLDAEGQEIGVPEDSHTATPGSGGVRIPFEQFVAPWPIDFPKPVNPERTDISRDWFCYPIPENAAAIKVRFGRSESPEEMIFRFSE